MNILVIRHAIAEDRELFKRDSGKGDSERPLTSKGRDRWSEGIAGLRALKLMPDVIWTSPYVRAVQSAAMLAKASKAPMETVMDLLPGAEPEQLLLRIFAVSSEVDTLALVGHEPFLSEFIEFCVPESYNSRRQSLKKAGACLISLKKHPKKGNVLKLEALFKAKHLRRAH